MSAHVFTDRALEKHAGRFVWLFIDIDDPKNADFQARYQVSSLPTFFVLDGSDGRVALQWLGNATVPQLESLLEDGLRAVADQGMAPYETALSRADRASGVHDYKTAAFDYSQALHLAPEDWSGRPRATESLLMALQLEGDSEACAEAAITHGPLLPPGNSRANVLSGGLGCALEAPETAWGKKALEVLEPLVLDTLTMEGVLADDRSSHYMTLVSAAQARGDEKTAKMRAEAWLSFLEAEAARAPTVAARSAFDSHRLAAAFELDQVERVIPALEASVKDLPEDYDPPYRLAMAYQGIGETQRALESVERALALAYGPRKVRIYLLKSDLQAKTGDLPAARETLLQAKVHVEGLPEGQRSPRYLPQIEKALKALDSDK